MNQLPTSIQNLDLITYFEQLMETLQPYFTTVKNHLDPNDDLSHVDQDGHITNCLVILIIICIIAIPLHCLTRDATIRSHTVTALSCFTISALAGPDLLNMYNAPSQCIHEPCFTWYPLYILIALHLYRALSTICCCCFNKNNSTVIETSPLHYTKVYLNILLFAIFSSVLFAFSKWDKTRNLPILLVLDTGPILNVILLCMTGTVDGIHYSLLILSQQAQISIVTQKYYTKWINILIRLPSLLLVAAIMIWNATLDMDHDRINVPYVAVIAGATYITLNGIFYTWQTSTDYNYNYHQELTRDLIKEEQVAQVAQVAQEEERLATNNAQEKIKKVKINSTTGRSKKKKPREIKEKQKSEVQDKQAKEKEDKAANKIKTELQKIQDEAKQQKLNREKKSKKEKQDRAAKQKQVSDKAALDQAKKNEAKEKKLKINAAAKEKLEKDKAETATKKLEADLLKIKQQAVKEKNKREQKAKEKAIAIEKAEKKKAEKEAQQIQDELEKVRLQAATDKAARKKIYIPTNFLKEKEATEKRKSKKEKKEQKEALREKLAKEKLAKEQALTTKAQEQAAKTKHHFKKKKTPPSISTSTSTSVSTPALNSTKYTIGTAPIASLPQYKKTAPVIPELPKTLPDFAPSTPTTPISTISNKMLGRVTPTTPLHAAAKKGSISDLKELLSSGEHDVNATLDETGHTALHQAVQFGRIKSVKMLLLHDDLDINKKDHNGISALHGAIENGYVDVVEVLLNAKGIDVNQSLVKLAIDEEEEDIVELLKKYKGTT